MKVFLLLTFLFAVHYSQTEDELSAVDLFEKFVDVEEKLKEQWKTNYQDAKDRQQEAQKRYKEAAQEMNEAFRQKAQQVQESIQKFRENKQQKQESQQKNRQELLDELRAAFQSIMAARNETKQREKEEISDLLSNLKEKWDQKMTEMSDEKRQEMEDFKNNWDQMRQQWTDYQNKIDSAKQMASGNQKQTAEEAQKEFEQLREAMQSEKQRREEAKQQRMEKVREKMDQYSDDIQAKKDDLQSLEQEVIAKMDEIMEKKATIQELIKKAIKDQAKVNLGEQLLQKVQETLDRQAAKEVLTEAESERKIAQQAGAAGAAAAVSRSPGNSQSPNFSRAPRYNEPIGTNQGEQLLKKVQDTLDQQHTGAAVVIAAVSPAPRATMLDEITGTAQWQTVTWILLALTILLAIALIALIMYQVAQRKQYQELEGRNDPERTPLTRHPEGLTYSDVNVPSPRKSILSTPRVGTSRIDETFAPAEEAVI